MFQTVWNIFSGNDKDKKNENDVDGPKSTDSNYQPTTNTDGTKTADKKKIDSSSESSCESYSSSDDENENDEFDDISCLKKKCDYETHNIIFRKKKNLTCSTKHSFFTFEPSTIKVLEYANLNVITSNQNVSDLLNYFTKNRQSRFVLCQNKIGSGKIKSKNVKILPQTDVTSIAKLTGASTTTQVDDSLTLTKSATQKYTLEHFKPWYVGFAFIDTEIENYQTSMKIAIIIPKTSDAPMYILYQENPQANSILFKIHKSNGANYASSKWISLVTLLKLRGINISSKLDMNTHQTSLSELINLQKSNTQTAFTNTTLRECNISCVGINKIISTSTLATFKILTELLWLDTHVPPDKIQLLSKCITLTNRLVDSCTQSNNTKTKNTVNNVHKNNNTKTFLFETTHDQNGLTNHGTSNLQFLFHTLQYRLSEHGDYNNNSYSPFTKLEHIIQNNKDTLQLKLPDDFFADICTKIKQKNITDMDIVTPIQIDELNIPDIQPGRYTLFSYGKIKLGNYGGNFNIVPSVLDDMDEKTIRSLFQD